MNSNTEKIIKDLYTEIVSKYNDKYLNNTLTREDGDELFNEIIFKKYLNIDPESERGQKIKNREEYLSYDETLIVASAVRDTLHLPNTRAQEKETTDAFKMLVPPYATMVLVNIKHWGFRFTDSKYCVCCTKTMTDDQKQMYADIAKMKEILTSTGKELKKSNDTTPVQESTTPAEDQVKESNDKDSLQKRIRELENDPRVQEYLSVQCKLREIELSEEMAEKEQQRINSCQLAAEQNKNIQTFVGGVANEIVKILKSAGVSPNSSEEWVSEYVEYDTDTEADVSGLRDFILSYYNKTNNDIFEEVAYNIVIRVENANTIYLSMQTDDEHYYDDVIEYTYLADFSTISYVAMHNTDVLKALRRL